VVPAKAAYFSVGNIREPNSGIAKEKFYCLPLAFKEKSSGVAGTKANRKKVFYNPNI